MTLVLVTPPDPVVSIEEAKAHLRIDHADEDNLITALVEAATATIDGRDGWLGRAIGVQTWDLSLDCGWWRGQGSVSGPHWWWGGYGTGWGIRLPLPPLRSVDTITYRNAAGTEQTLAPESYVVSGVGSGQRGRVTLASGVEWPDVQAGPEALTIRFTAGYEEVPAPIKAAILLNTARLYEQRENPNSDLGGAAMALLGPYRVFA
jgi:hypothetical protein